MSRVIISAETSLSEALPASLRQRLLTSLTEEGLITVEDLYECQSHLGGTWYRHCTGISRADAVALTDWLASISDVVGEIPENFYPAGYTPRERAQNNINTTSITEGIITSSDNEQSESESTLSPVSMGATQLIAASQQLADQLSGALGQNRATSDTHALEAENDFEAIQRWLAARATNPNTLSQYRNVAERFMLWCTLERGKALSSISAQDAALYPRWLEELGRTDPQEWAKHWKLAQTDWIAAKSSPRFSPEWRPFKGPMSINSRRATLTIIRILFGFLVRTGYLRFNPFDQVSTKVRFLPGEGAPKAFADRSLSPNQWQEVLNYLDNQEDNIITRRMRVVLSLGKGLGMRASEMINAQAGWITIRRIGDEDLMVIEIVGKGDKIRRLPLASQTLTAINAYFEARELPSVHECPPDTPLIDNLGIGRAGKGKGLSRSGLYNALQNFFEKVAESVEERSAADAAKLRASSTHWLRHTFATTALRQMDINVVQNAMGHASIGTTSRYLTPEEAEIARSMKKMDPI